MRQWSKGVQVAIFAAVLVAAAVLAYRWVSKGTREGDGYVVFVLMKDAVGVAKHSQVRMAGIPIGTIRDVRLEGDKARVDIEIRRDVPLYEDASVAKVASSLLGEYFLAIAPGTAGKRQLVDGDQILFVIEAATVDSLLKDANDIVADVKKVTASLARTVGSDKGEQNIDVTLQNLAEATAELNKIVKENRATIRTILTDVERVTQQGRPEVVTILANVSEITKEVRRLLDRGQREGTAEPGEVRQIIDKVNRAASSLETALAAIDRVSGRLDRGEGTLGRLTTDETLIDEVEGAASGVNEFIGGVSRLQTIVGLRSDYQFLASTVKTYAELRLQPREDKYYVIEVVNDPRGLTRIEQIDVQTDNPNEPPVYREVRTVTTNAFRFSLQYAQTFGAFTGRFGIKESTGGIGLDLALFDDRFELRQDLFGFGEVVLPRWRVALGYEFIARLWLLGGIDDILSPENRDYFVGMQLRFNDEDLKGILPFTPSF